MRPMEAWYTEYKAELIFIDNWKCKTKLFFITELWVWNNAAELRVVTQDDTAKN